MTTHVFGPRGGNMSKQNVQGLGIIHQKVDNGWGSVTGSEAGDVRIVNMPQLGNGPVQLGYGFQAVGADVKVAFTCVNPSLDGTAGFSESDVWVNELDVPVGDIKFFNDLVFTMMRVTFVAPGELHFVIR